MNVIYYEGERICFRPIELEDEPLLRRWVNDPCVWATLGMRPPINAVRERRIIEDRPTDGSDFMFGIETRDEQRLIGCCGLHRVRPVERRATFGLMIGDRERQGRGYGGEATRLCVRFGFEELNLHRIELDVFDFNPRGIRAYERAGFTFEGRQRQACYRHGKYHDVLCYAILREEWDAMQRCIADEAEVPA